MISFSGSMIDGKPIITLPTKTITLKKVEFSEEERIFYTNLEAESREQFKVHSHVYKFLSMLLLHNLLSLRLLMVNIIFEIIIVVTLSLRLSMTTNLVLDFFFLLI